MRIIFGIIITLIGGIIGMCMEWKFNVTSFPAYWFIGFLTGLIAASFQK